MPKLRIDIEDIGEEGLSLEETLEQGWVEHVLSEGQEEAFAVRGPMPISARIDPVDGGFLLDGSMSPRLSSPCRRCLRPVDLALPTHFTLSLVPKSMAMAREGREDDRSGDQGPRGSFDPSVVDEETFDSRIIDLEPLFREQFLLALPMDALCHEDCKGLCPSCGKDLNLGACGCARRAADPRWEKLRSIKLSN